jgi:hypothetical protein
VAAFGRSEPPENTCLLKDWDGSARQAREIIRKWQANSRQICSGISEDVAATRRTVAWPRRRTPKKHS